MENRTFVHDAAKVLEPTLTDAAHSASGSYAQEITRVAEAKRGGPRDRLRSKPLSHKYPHTIH